MPIPLDKSPPVQGLAARVGPQEMQVIEIARYGDVTQIRMARETNGRPYLWASAYLVDGLLIDTGLTHTAHEMVRLLEATPPDLVVNTHHHEDHIGANHLISEKFGCPILAHPDSLPNILDPPEIPSYREFAWGRAVPSAVEPLGDVVKTPRFTFRVIDTPGHCQGHVALVEMDRGWCFSGDLYVGERPVVMGPEHDVRRMVESMEKLLGLPTDRLVLFTAMRTVEPEGKEALRTSIDYLTDLSRRAKALTDRGRSIPDIVRELFGAESVYDSLTAGQYSSAHFVRLLLEADP